ncbi:unnamed protein product, partial [marine sediment metagenome]
QSKYNFEEADILTILYAKRCTLYANSLIS